MKYRTATDLTHRGMGPHGRLFRQRRLARHGFTLIELLVVITIIGVLIAILLPSLGAARREANKVVCASNLRQIAIGMLTYESEHDRLPVHVREIAVDNSDDSQATWASQVRDESDSADARPVWRDLVGGTKQIYHCPLMPGGWDPFASDASRVYLEYFTTPGYWGDGSGQSIDTPWTQSEEGGFEYEGARFSVLAGDRMMFNLGGPSGWVNHPDSRGGIEHLFNDGGAGDWGGNNWVFRGANILDRFDANYVMLDGSVYRATPGDDRLREVHDRHESLPNATWLLPAD